MGAALALSQKAASTAENVRRRARFWRRPAARVLTLQALVAMLVMGALVVGAVNLNRNLAQRSMSLGFDFLTRNASFEIGDNFVGYSAGRSYLYAFAAGFANTVQVALLGIVLTAGAGLAVALLRLSGNPLVSRIARAYVEVARNTPLLLQLFFWHSLLVHILPAPRQAWRPLSGVFISNRGLMLPTIEGHAILPWILVATGLGGVAAALVLRHGSSASWKWSALALPFLFPSVTLMAALDMLTTANPVLRGLNFVGGTTVSPELVTLVWALVFYQSAFLSETIRAGVLGVPRGMIEAAEGLGLPWVLRVWFVVLPQAFRAVVPSMTSQFVSLAKNSSLAIAVGYPDLIRVSTVAISDTGRVVECTILTMATYLAMSLLTALGMNRWNARMARQGW